MRGQTEPRTRVRKLYQVDLWEISIVTFPLLNGARVAAVKEAPQSRLRARAEQEWQAVQQDMQNLDLSGAAEAPAPLIRRGARRMWRCAAAPTANARCKAWWGAGRRRGDVEVSRHL